ncbi:IpaD/SipD/SspD family type III secretion system needle tip protein [Salmonella enterica]
MDVTLAPSLSLPVNDLPQNLNTRQVITLLETPTMPFTQEDIETVGALLNQFSHPTNEAGVQNKTINQALFKIEQAQLLVDGQNGSEVERTIKAQQALVNETGSALENISNETRNEALKTQRTYSALAGQLNTLKTDTSSNNADNNVRAIDTGSSYAELWGRIAVAITNIKSEYVDWYAELMQKFTELYEGFNSTVQKASSQAVSTGDDGNNVKFNTGTMQSGYDKFNKIIDSIEQDIGSIKNWGSLSASEKESLLTSLKPAFAVDESNGKIWINNDQYYTVRGTFPSGISDGKVSTASYQAWLATFNAAGSTYQSNMQSFAQRYSQSNSTFDNLNKVLSGAISSLADSAKDVLKSLG